MDNEARAPAVYRAWLRAILGSIRTSLLLKIQVSVNMVPCDGKNAWALTLNPSHRWILAPVRR